jgi:hypothetical protein
MLGVRNREWTRGQKLMPGIALLVMLLAIGWTLLPFEFAEGVKCGPPLLGGHPKSEASVGLIIPKLDCHNKARSRLLTSALIALAAAAAGTAIVALQPISPQCYNGNHDDCPYWWANLVGNSGLGCQCDCHESSSVY